MPTLTPLLSIQHASKTYDGTPALIDAALELLPGEVHALMGENGAGKSTLIKILAGVVRPDRAEIRINGQPVSLHSPKAAYDRGLRFIHQELQIVPQIAVAENLALSQPYPRWLGVLVDWQRLYRQASESLGRLGISHIDPRQLMAHLSMGDRMLVKIAAAFAAGAAKASIYILDEPTAALNAAEATRLFAVIRELKAQGCGILYVSHRMDEVFEICHTVTVMRDGRVVASQPIQQTSRAGLIRQMTGREVSHAYPPRTNPVHEEVVLEGRGLLNGVDFQLRGGEILGIAGLAGAGQSELLKAIMGAVLSKAGTLSLNGRSLRPRHPTDGWRRGFAYVPQERRVQGLLLSRSVRENISLPHLRRLSMGGLLLDQAHEEQTAAALGSQVRLKSTGSGQRTRQLSGGNQQKVVFARAMAGQPRLLLLDEPTRGVDVGARFDLYTLIRQASLEGTAILLASSDLGELLGLCDRILILRQGRSAAPVNAAGLTQHDLLALCYG
jgi:ABC-type sugar transport system ATPase subunit